MRVKILKNLREKNHLFSKRGMHTDYETRHGATVTWSYPALVESLGPGIQAVT